MYAEVIVDIASSNVDKVFDYDIGQLNILKGMRVLVPFGKKSIEGFVVNVKQDSAYDKSKIKQIIKPLDDAPIISQEMFEIMEYVISKHYNLKVDMLRLFIPSAMRGGKVRELIRQFAKLSDEYRDVQPETFIRKGATAQSELYYYLKDVIPDGDFVSQITKKYSASSLRNFASRGIVELSDKSVRRVPHTNIDIIESNHKLTDSQQSAVEQIKNVESETFLLHGVTGSGKTEVYMRLIEDVLKKGKTAIMLVPEISLTVQVLRNFKGRFGDNVSLLHSGLSDGEKFDEWCKALSGEAKVVLGARSAIFAPLKNVGLIIIDEEHDGSYVSEHTPRYKTIEIAEIRRQYNNCNLILGSATPSIESYYNAINGTYKLITMPDRVNKKPLPAIKIVNMCQELAHGNNTIFSEELLRDIDECLKSGNQCMLFINRRGSASYVMCRSCGYIAKCERCDVSLVYHNDENVLKCHYCGNRYGVINVCPECGYEHLKQGFVGTQSVVRQLSKIFPNANIIRMDNDNTRTKDAHVNLLKKFSDREADILVGTQMIAKGHDFPDVTLVGILDSDMSLHFADYRSAERTFQLTTQVAGRAGRAGKPGKVVLQTHTPRHYVYNFVRGGDYVGFYNKESNLRDVTKYPPYSVIVKVLVSGADSVKASEVLKNIYDDIIDIRNKSQNEFVYLGYMHAPIKKINNEYRMQIIARLNLGCDDIVDNIFKIVEKHKVINVTSYAEINPARMS